ncbi:hypothetical protein RSOLAG22IIIB_07507 [Rhizoctonia solani]|uniref:Uncharacterized protein n=1 Tax=Rhizoctonia solani TaxID=456999 RepID=A0A0K6FN06_9AGAM|nr:hypothetical protein RSOLAG22IIIB_07507 [Rhizoctonia solani]
MPLWRSIVQKLDWSGKPKDQAVEVEGAKALEVLQQVDTLLDESLKMLVSAKPALSNREINMFEDKHSELYLAVVAVKSEVRDKKDQDDFFSSPEEKTEFYTEVQKLLRQCQTYHRDVLTASQRARLNKSRLNISDIATSASSTEQTLKSSSNLSWVTVALSAGSSAEGEGEGEGEGPGEMIRHLAETSGEYDSGLPYLANIVHIPKSALATEEELLSMLPDDNHFYRVVMYGNKRKRVVLMDPNLYSIDKEDSDDDGDYFTAMSSHKMAQEISVGHPQNEIFKVGKMLMKKDPESLKDNATYISYEGTSFVTSIISLLSLNPSNNWLGMILDVLFS